VRALAKTRGIPPEHVLLEALDVYLHAQAEAAPGTNPAKRAG
jgi:hypothetical protein